MYDENVVPKMMKTMNFLIHPIISKRDRQILIMPQHVFHMLQNIYMLNPNK